MSAERSPDDDDGFADGGVSSSCQDESYWRERWERRIAMVREALIERAVELVSHFRGAKPTGRARRGKVRWGRKGSFELTLTGRYRGRYYDFEAGEGGDLFALIMRDQGLNFGGAVEWGAQWAGLPSDYQPSAEEILRQSERDAAPSAKEAEEAAKEDAEEAKKIALVRKIWDEARPIDGTLGEKYLYETRGIYLTDFPLSLRWRTKESAVVCAVTDDAGGLVAVQKIAVTSEGTKDKERWLGKGGAKTSIGLVSRGAVRFSGPSDGCLCLAEGPETGLTVWAANSHETHVLVGGFAGAIRHLLADNGTPKEWVRDRRIILCRDDDPRISPASKSLQKVFKVLRASGLDVRVATPFRVRRVNKADFNDLAQERGLDAVRARIEMVAIDYEPFEEPVIPVENARKQLDERVGEFFDLVEARAREEVVAGAPADETTDSSEEIVDFSKASLFGNRPPVHAVGVTVGVGKTEAALRHALRKLIEMRKIGDERSIVFALPEHELSAKVAARFNKMAKDAGVDLRAGVWRGREAKQPDSASGEKMCVEIETMRLALNLHADIEKEVCPECPVINCAYLTQRGDDADLWIVAHQIIFHEPPPPVAARGVAALVVDESPWRAGLIGTEGEGIEIELSSLSLMAIPSGDYGRELAKIRAKLELALSEEKDGPVRRQALVDAGLSYGDAVFAGYIEWRRKIEDGHWRDRVENATLTPMEILWKAVAFTLLDARAEASGRMTLDVNRQDRFPRKVIRVFGLKDINSAWSAPTLLIDATLDIDLVSPFWQNVEDKGRLDVSAPHQFVRQATSKSWALSSLIAKEEPENEDGSSRPTSDEDIKEAAKAARNAAKQRTTAKNNLRKLRTTIMTRAREIGGKTLVISNKAVIEALALPPHTQTGHFNAIAGRDDWGDVALLIVIGRPMPPPEAVERMAGAINGDAPATVEGWYQRADAFRLQRVADGFVVPVLAESDFHPDDTCERIRYRTCVGEIIQGMGRARGVNRGPDNPVEILVLGDAILPIAVDEFLPDDFAWPSATELQLAEGGVAFRDGTSAATAYPQLWRTATAARKAIERERREDRDTNPINVTFSYGELPIGECHADHHVCPAVRFQRSGPKLHEEMAIYDPIMVPDPRAAIEKLVGPLAMFELVGRDAREEAPEQGEDLTRDGKAFVDALQAALDAKRRTAAPDGSDAPMDSAVALQAVREAFYRSRPAEGADANRIVEARRRAFNRGKKAAVASGLVALDEGGKLMWLAEPKVEEALSRAPQSTPLPIVSISNAIIVDDPPPLDPAPAVDGRAKPGGAPITATVSVTQQIRRSSVLRMWMWLASPARKAA